MTFAAALAELSGFSVRDLLGLGKPPASASDIRVFFSGVYSEAEKPKSDFELRRGNRTLLFVRIPRLREPANRLVFATAFVRPVNMGSRSMSGAYLTTIFADKAMLWHPSLGDLDRESITSLSGEHDFGLRVEHVDGRRFIIRTLPRLDPMTGFPVPISFLLQIHGVTPDGKEVHLDTEGEMEIRMSGPDWVSLTHVLDIRCIPVDSAEEFMDLSRALASSLRSKRYPNVPVLLADTGGQNIFSEKGGPTIIQAKIDTLHTIKRRMLHDF